MKDFDYYIDAAASLELPTEAVIDGRLVPAASGRRFPSISPRDGSTLAEVAECDVADVDMAVACARAAFDHGRWSRMAPRDRRAVLLRLAELMEDHREELALLDSLDMGKPIADAVANDLRVSITCVEYFAEAIDKVYGEVAPSAYDSLATITREPLGVVGAVVPWNFPLQMMTWKIAPALAAGNSVVVKPAEQSPLSALRMGQLALEAGLPPGVLNVVPGFGPTAGAALGLHGDVDGIAFTGSGEVGAQFMRYSADSNLKRVSLELGGKSPQIVFADAPDVTAVAEGISDGIFYNQGEVCSAGSRLLVHRSRKDDLLQAVVANANARPPGDPLDPATKTGALVESAHLERVIGYLESGSQEGAVTVTGGQRALVDSGGFYVEPTVLDEVAPGMRVAQEEIFGPVLAVMAFDEAEEAIAIANGTRYGLAAAIWSKDISTALLTAKAVKAGVVWVNNYEGGDVTVPFGGYRESGFGRDQSLHALDNYSQLKTTWIAL